MSYLDDHLLPDEHIVHRAHLHWIIFGSSILCLTLGIGAGLVLYLQFPADRYWLAGIVVVALGLVLAIGPALRYMSADFAVTDKRVLAKHGIVRRQSLETLLSKVEAIGVDQDVTGRLLNYGTITITGTGGTRETLPAISHPMEFRRRVQAQIVEFENRGRGGYGERVDLVAPRAERECPYCAEPILVKARICKHCGRDVTVTTSAE